MKYKIQIDKNFSKEFKFLQKKYPFLKADFQSVLDNIEKELALAVDLGNGFKKIRIAIKSKNKGSSGGGRIITYESIIAINEANLIFASIYDKNEFETIDIAVLKKNLELN